MQKNRNGNLVSDTHRNCTKCGVIFERTSKNMSICHKCNTERVKSGSPEYKMLARAKRRCKESGLEFNLVLEDIVIPESCPVLGIPLKVNSGRSGAYRDSPSLDRIDNSQGYVVGNIQIISQLANAMKCHATIEELRKFSLWVLDTYGESGAIEPQILIRKVIEPKTRRVYSPEEVLQYTVNEAMKKFGISKGHYNIIKAQMSSKESI